MALRVLGVGGCRSAHARRCPVKLLEQMDRRGYLVSRGLGRPPERKSADPFTRADLLLDVTAVSDHILANREALRNAVFEGTFRSKPTPPAAHTWIEFYDNEVVPPGWPGGRVGWSLRAKDLGASGIADADHLRMLSFVARAGHVSPEEATRAAVAGGAHVRSLVAGTLFIDAQHVGPLQLPFGFTLAVGQDGQQLGASAIDCLSGRSLDLNYARHDPMLGSFCAFLVPVIHALTFLNEGTALEALPKARKHRLQFHTVPAPGAANRGG